MNQRTKLVITVLLMLFSFRSFSQNVSSPYSILGIGDIESDDYGRFAATGSAAVSRRAVGFYNFWNPASLTVMGYKSVNLDFAFRGRFSSFQTPGTDTFTSVSKDFIIKRISLALKTGKKNAIAFGLKPFSSVNYQYQTNSSINDGDASYGKYTSGSGGIYESYFSFARELSQRISIGATASWLFGSLQREVNYYNPDYGLDIIRSENKFYYGAGLRFGVQYYSLPGKKWQHYIGATLAGTTNLNGQTTTTYTSSDSIIDKTVVNSAAFKMPISFSGGYSISNRKGLLISSQFSFDKWPAQILTYTNSFTTDAFAFKAGVEYSKKHKLSQREVEDYYVGIGGKFEQSYLQVNGQKLNNYSIVMGGGKNMSRVLSLNGSIEVGRRGSRNLNQIRENFTQFSLGITLKDFWAGTKNFGRFN